MTKLRLAVARAELIGRLHYFRARNGIPVGRIPRFGPETITPAGRQDRWTEPQSRRLRAVGLHRRWPRRPLTAPRLLLPPLIALLVHATLGATRGARDAKGIHRYNGFGH
jgi:hypothetical protein